MLWLLQFFIGVFLAYYIISPRLRGFVNHLVLRILRIKPFIGVSYPKVKFRYVLEDKGDTEELGEPLEPEPIILGTKHGIVVGADKVEEWLSRNPDLVKVNNSKK